VFLYVYTKYRDKSKEHFEQAFAYQPLKSKYLHDYRFYNILPEVSIVLPTLGRPEGLKRCLDSIQALNYPKDCVETIVIEDEPRKGVPLRMKEGVEKSKGTHLVFASNDIEFHPDSLILAVMASKDKSLVAFNTGPACEGNMCEHFLIKKCIIEKIGGEVFDTRYNHVGVDQLLWAKCEKLGEAIRLEDAKVKHFHFSTGGSEFDEVYKIAWDEGKVKEDRERLEKDLMLINK